MSRDSPELSDSFELFLEERKKKAQVEKMKLLGVEDKQVEEVPEEQQEPAEKPLELTEDSLDEQEEPQEISSDKEELLSETLCDDSFLEMEKLCENTLHLNNISEHLVDLTSLEMQENTPKQQQKHMKMISEETFLHDVEAPSFMMNNTLFSPPAAKTQVNRPSTIMEVSEANQTSLTSYQTAEGTVKSEDYQTALDDSWISKQNYGKRFYQNSIDFTKDSLDVSGIKASINELASFQDSLNNKENITLELESDESFDMSKSARMNDTLEAIEKILAQGMMEQTPATVVTPKQPNKASPTPWSVNKNFQAKPSPLINRVLSPMMKFSPTSNVKSPQQNFKFPKPLSTTKTPQFSSLSKQKFQHIVSPISRYINNTPEVPLTNAHIHAQYGISGGTRQFNFRDSETFAAEPAVQATTSALPVRVKTTSSKKVTKNYQNLRIFH